MKECPHLLGLPDPIVKELRSLYMSVIVHQLTCHNTPEDLNVHKKT
jgi:hypothetical protein